MPPIPVAPPLFRLRLPLPPSPGRWMHRWGAFPPFVLILALLPPSLRCFLCTLFCLCLACVHCTHAVAFIPIPTPGTIPATTRPTPFRPRRRLKRRTPHRRLIPRDASSHRPPSSLRVSSPPIAPPWPAAPACPLFEGEPVPPATGMNPRITPLVRVVIFYASIGVRIPPAVDDLPSPSLTMDAPLSAVPLPPPLIPTVPYPRHTRLIFTDSPADEITHAALPVTCLASGQWTAPNPRGAYHAAPIPRGCLPAAALSFHPFACVARVLPVILSRSGTLPLY